MLSADPKAGAALDPKAKLGGDMALAPKLKPAEGAAGVEADVPNAGGGLEGACPKAGAGVDDAVDAPPN